MFQVYIQIVFLYQTGEETYSQDSSMWNLTHIGDDLCNQSATKDGSGGATSSRDTYPHMFKLASIDSFDSKWYVEYIFKIKVV